MTSSISITTPRLCLVVNWATCSVCAYLVCRESSGRSTTYPPVPIPPEKKTHHEKKPRILVADGFTGLQRN
jgi:hypothetical protein